MTTSWERFRARWLKNKTTTSFDNPKLDALVAAAFFCDARDVKTIAQTSRTAQRAAKHITKRIRADVTRGCARQPVPVVGGAGFPRGFRYASRVVAPPGYDDFRERPRGDVHAPVAVAWLAAHGCWGLVAAADLEAGTRVCDYAGALVSRAAARRREADDAAAGRPTYVLSVVEHSLDESVPAWRTTVDATEVGGVARFANHSCDPNCDVVARRAARGQLLPTLALVTRRRVAKGAQLCFDYAGLDDGGAAAAPVATEATATPCFCGARACRGFLLRHRA